MTQLLTKEKISILSLFIFLVFLPSSLADPIGWLNDTLVVDNGRLATLQSPKMAMDKQGNNHVVWWDVRDHSCGICSNGAIYYKKLDNQGKNLTDDIRVSFGFRASSEGHSLAIDDNGNIHVVWEDGRDGNDEIYYKKLDNNGNSLSVETRLTFDLATSLRPKITANHGQNADVHIIWTDNRRGNFAVYYTRLDNTGRTLTDDTWINNSLQYAHADSIDIDSLNNVHIFYTGDGDALYYKKLNPVGFPITPQIRIMFTSVQGNALNAFVDKQDNIHLAMSMVFNVYQRYIYYKKLDSIGNNLTDDIKITDDAVNIRNPTNPDIGIDECGNIHLAWQQDIDAQGNNEIFYTKLYGTGNKMVENTRLTYAPKNSESPSLAIDPYDGVHLVWLDNRNGHWSGYQWEVWYKRSIPTIPDADIYLDSSIACPVEVLP